MKTVPVITKVEISPQTVKITEKFKISVTVEEISASKDTFRMLTFQFGSKNDRIQ